jgi:hypothetical protein
MQQGFPCCREAHTFYLLWFLVRDTKRGAYSQFKELLEYRGALENWHAFEKHATERALKQWCDEREIQIVSEPVV